MLCVIMMIDSTATEQLSRATQAAKLFGYTPKDVHGHITLATYLGDDEEGFISSCKSILSAHNSFDVSYDKIEAWSSPPIENLVTYCSSSAKRF